jgi:hypothetical protein
VFSLIVVCLAVSPSSAKEIILTGERVTGFLKSLPELQVIAASEGLNNTDTAKAKGDPFSTLMKAIKASKLRSETKTIVAKYGFASIQEWFQTGAALGRAYAFVTAGSARVVARDAVDKHKVSAVKELDKLGLLTEKQKQRLKGHVEDASAQLSSEPPEENVAIVTAMKSAIDKAVKNLRE